MGPECVVPSTLVALQLPVIYFLPEKWFWETLGTDKEICCPLAPYTRQSYLKWIILACLNRKLFFNLS